MTILILLPTQLVEVSYFPFNPTQIIIYNHPKIFLNCHASKANLLLNATAYYKTYIISTLKIPVKIVSSLSSSLNFSTFDPVDHEIYHLYKSYNPTFYPTPLFLESIQDLQDFKKLYPNGKHKTFYEWNLKRLNISLPKNKSKTSYDEFNKQRFPKDYTETPLPKITYPLKKLSSNEFYGEIFPYPYTHKLAKDWFTHFIKYNLHNFGTYEDAFNDKVIFGNHSVLSALLNIGLITPKYILKKIISVADQYHINDIEGFIRQLIGWRSFCRYIYFTQPNLTTYSKTVLPTTLLKSWKNLQHPVLTPVINKQYKYGYCHHIERLMILSNYAQLNNFSTKEILGWFYYFVDAYEWVMLPNVICMALYLYPTMTTRPYICSSNYIIKMSGYKKGEWSEEWDKLYKKYLTKNKKKLQSSYMYAAQYK